MGIGAKVKAFFALLAARYTAILSMYPMATNMTTGAVIAGLGDIAVQKWFEQKASLDVKRTVHMAAIRAFVVAPFVSWYFPWLNRLIPGSTMPRVLARVVADQFIGSPTTITMTFVGSALLQGKPETIPSRMREQLIPAWKNGVTYWPFVHSINFRFTPVHHQPLVAHVASLYWNAVLSYRANLKLKIPDAIGEQPLVQGEQPATMNAASLRGALGTQGLAPATETGKA